MSNEKQNPIGITLMSIGGRGANVLERLPAIESLGVTRASVGLNEKAFNRLDIIHKIKFPAYSRDLSMEEPDETTVRQNVASKRGDISEILVKSKITFLIGNLGSVVSAFQAAEIASIAHESGNLVFFIGAMPFFFEGVPKLKVAEINKKLLNGCVDGVIAVDSDRLIVSGVSAYEAMTKIDQTVLLLINSIIELIRKCGFINVDFADLKTTIQNAGEVFFNSVIGSREDIASMTASLFSKTYLHHGITRMERMLYVIYAGKDLLMDEIRAIGEQIKERASDNARVIFGIVNDEQMKNDIRLVLIGA